MKIDFKKKVLGYQIETAKEAKGNRELVTSGKRLPPKKGWEEDREIRDISAYLFL